MTVKVRADRRFRRVQVRRSRRRSGWRGRWGYRLRRVLVACPLLYLTYVGADAFTHHPVFEIDVVVVRGNERLSTGEIMILLEGLRRGSLLRADLDLWRQRLQTSSWVETAALHRVLPSTVEVQITERIPTGIARIVNRLYLVDRTGTIIDGFGPHYADLDLPLIDGLATTSADGTPTIADAGVQLATRLLDQLRPHEDLARRVSQIDVSNQHDAVVILEGDHALVHLGEGRFVERLQAYLELAPTLRQRVPAIDYVDLRFDERVYVRPEADESSGGSLQASQTSTPTAAWRAGSRAEE